MKYKVLPFQKHSLPQIWIWREKTDLHMLNVQLQEKYQLSSTFNNTASGQFLHYSGE